MENWNWPTLTWLPSHSGDFWTVLLLLLPNMVTNIWSHGSLICPGGDPGKDCPDMYTRDQYRPLYTLYMWGTRVYSSIPLGLLCPKHCLLRPIVKITHSERGGGGGEKNYNWKIVLSLHREHQGKSEKYKLTRYIDTRFRNVYNSKHIFFLHTIHTQLMVVPISSEFLLVWRWLISRVLNTMQSAHIAHVMASVTSHQAGTSSLITWTWHGGNFLETLLTSDIWIQFNQIFMSSEGHYQGNDLRRLFTARWCYSTLIKTIANHISLGTCPRHSI